MIDLNDASKLKVVGISSCSAGIAHTYMNASAMQKIAKQYGFKVHIEKQGQLGPEDVVSQKEFDEADVIVLCCGVNPLNPERFEKYPNKIIELGFNDVLKKPILFIKALQDHGYLKK